MHSPDTWAQVTRSQVLIFGDDLPRARALWLAAETLERGSRSAQRLRECGSVLYAERNRASGAVRWVAPRCDQRVCPRCAKIHARALARRIVEWMGRVVKNQWRMITLTLRSSDAPLVAQLARLRRCLRALRQERLWNGTQRYGRAFIEVTWNAETKQWHPHAHCLTRGGYIAQDALSRVWLKVTGDSPIVHVTAIKSGKQAGRYVCKYASKGGGGEDAPADPAVLVDLVSAMRRCRWSIAFGDQPALPDDPDPPRCTDPPGTWTRIWTYGEALHLAESKHAGATAALAALALRPPPPDAPP